jgi:hypothetical protein
MDRAGSKVVELHSTLLSAADDGFFGIAEIDVDYPAPRASWHSPAIGP